MNPDGLTRKEITIAAVVMTICLTAMIALIFGG